ACGVCTVTSSARSSVSTRRSRSTRLTVSAIGSAGTAPSQPSFSAVSSRSITSSGTSGRAASCTSTTVASSGTSASASRTDLDRRRGLGLRLLLTVADAGEDAVEPLGGLLLVHVLCVHELGGEDLLRLHEHLLLAGREALLVIAQREVAHDLGQLEDVAGLHLVAVVLEAAIPVLRHLGGAAREGLDDHLDHLLVDHPAEPHLLRI